MKRRTTPTSKPYSGARAVALFMVIGLGAVVLTGVLCLSIARRTATSEAIRDARDLTDVDARSVRAAITDAVAAGDPSAVTALDAAVHDRVLTSRVVRVKVWDGNGRIVYSDASPMIGQTFVLRSDERTAIRTGRIDAEVSDLTRPENRAERKYGKLLEVYVGIRTDTGTPLLFETYQRFDTVVANGRRVLGEFAPALLSGLVVLWLAQLPLALGLTRRIQAGHQRERDLLRRAVESSQQERRRIAADLHDTVVQGLAGTSMSLSAIAVTVRRAGQGGLGDEIDERAGELRQWVRELRTLLVSIAPPRLHEEGLAAAIDDLASAARARGLRTEIDVAHNLHLSRTAETLVFRGAQEALRNTLSHAEARSVSISVRNGGPDIDLVVADDGVGFAPGDLEAVAGEGHMGLRLLRELAADAGGRLTVVGHPGEGTTVVLTVPAD